MKKYLFVLLVILPFFALPAQAQIYGNGTQSNPYLMGVGICHTGGSGSNACPSQAVGAALSKLRTEVALNCSPTVGTSCAAQEGKWYSYHMTQVTGGGRSSFTSHYEWKAEVFSVGTQPEHFLIWGVQITYTYLGSDHGICGLPP